MKRIIITICLGLIIQIASAQGPASNLLFNAFKQGNVNGGGNCASIALIKACIGTFGIGKVFDINNLPDQSGVVVILRNQEKVRVTFDEIKLATKENGFAIKSNDVNAQAIKAYADTCFAVMVKVNIGVKKLGNFNKSLSNLLEGYFTPDIHKLLGVNFKKMNEQALSVGRNIVFYNSYHAVYADSGYYDETKEPLGYSRNNNFAGNRFGWKCSLYLCRPNDRILAIDITNDN